MQNVSLSSEEPQLCHEAYNYLRYLFSYMAVQISKNKNAMIEGRKKDTQLFRLSFPLFGASRMAKILFKQHFDTNAGAIDWDSNTGVMLSGKMSISS